MKVYIIFDSDFECGGNYRGIVYLSERKAKNYVKRKNKIILERWLDFAEKSDSKLLALSIKEHGSKEAYAKHMLEQEEYYYAEAEVK